MITTHIFGGLGNQLFQYCCGRALSLRHNVKLRLLWDGREKENTTTRAFDLGHFNIQSEIIMSPKPLRRLGLRSIQSFLQYGPARVFRESALGYDPRFASLGPHARLKGYWQSEKFFKAFEDTVREELNILTPPSAQNQSFLDQIASHNTVSLHVRRGDYVTNPLANAHHGICDLGYYKTAIEYIAGKTQKAPIFYIFSDDIAWAKQNLKPRYETIFVDLNDEATNYEDLRLMSSCRHHIIANSSFSWWGAWLNRHAEKIIVAPKNWYADPAARNPDMLPHSWITCA